MLLFENSYKLKHTPRDGSSSLLMGLDLELPRRPGMSMQMRAGVCVVNVGGTIPHTTVLD